MQAGRDAMIRRRRLAYAAFRVPADAPISALNTTPLIDVMLVLLIMFIVTIPIMSHSVKIDLPPDVPGPAKEPETHLIALDAAGRLSWDGAPIAETALPAQLAAFTAGPADNVLHFRTDAEARYEDFDRVLAIVKRAGVERLGFPGNERFVQALSGR
jgi:biopolymer transport protein ExbD